MAAGVTGTALGLRLRSFLPQDAAGPVGKIIIDGIAVQEIIETTVCKKFNIMMESTTLIYDHFHILAWTKF